MVRNYISYGLTLISAFMVYWMFGLMATVSAGYTWVPLSGFLASLIHFGINSWLFLNFPKVGRVIAVITAIILCIWPILALASLGFDWGLFGTLIFGLPIIFSGIVIYNHIKTFKENQKPKLIVRIIMSVIPFGLLTAYIIYILKLIKTGQITIG